MLSSLLLCKQFAQGPIGIGDSFFRGGECVRGMVVRFLCLDDIHLQIVKLAPKFRALLFGLLFLACAISRLRLGSRDGLRS